MHPLFDIVEGLFVSNIVDNDDALGSSIVAWSQSSESFLSSSVPDLQFDDLFIQLNGLDLEVDSDGVEEVLVEGVLRVSQQQTGLTYAWVAD